MKRIFSLLVLLFAGTVVFAQSADVVTDILEAEEVTYGQVCYLSAIHQGLISEEADYDKAVEILYNLGQIPEAVGAYDPVVMANLAFIYAQIWPEMKGGLMFKLTKGAPRYAFKQFKADGVIDENAQPDSVLSGVDALNILTSCMMEYGTAECMEMGVE